MSESAKASAMHTPGPWRVDDFCIESVSHGNVAIVNIVRHSQADLNLIAAAPDLLAVLHEGRRAIGDHFAPNDCYATGPLTGDKIRDLVQCPACSFIAAYDAVVAKAEGRP